MGLNFVNKKSASHIDWRKMKLKLAAETLSSSTADALKAFNCLNINEFKNGESYNRVISSRLKMCS